MKPEGTATQSGSNGPQPELSLAQNTAVPDLPMQPKKFEIDIGGAEIMRHARAFAIVAISDDGMKVAYVADIDGAHRLFVHDLATLETIEVPDAYNPMMPDFSPDGEWLYYYVTRPNVPKLNPSLLMRYRMSTGQMEEVVESVPAGTAIFDDGTIIYQGQDEDLRLDINPYFAHLYKISLGGGEPERVTFADGPNTGEWTHSQVRALPEGRGALFTVLYEVLRSIAVLDPVSYEYRVIIEDAQHAHYVNSGHIVFLRGEQLWAVPFDLETLTVTGEEVRVLDGIQISPAGMDTFTVSLSGALLYVPKRSPLKDRRRLVWVDHDGREMPLDLDYGAYIQARASFDGKQVAVVVGDGDFMTQANIYIHDVDRAGSLRRLTTEQTGRPTWIPGDPRHLIYGQVDDGRMRIMVRRLDGLGEPQLIYRAVFASAVPNAMTPTGDHLFFGTATRETDNDVSMISLEPSLSEVLQTKDWKRNVDTLIATPASEGNLSFSPDGKYFAYSADYRGVVHALVRPFPNVDDGQWTIDTDQGSQPRWSSDGTKIYFQHGAKMYEVDVETEPTFSSGTPRLLFEKQYFTLFDGYPNYDLEYPEGERFLMIAPYPELNTTKLVYIENWAQELIARVPASENQ